jgi:hypothetical protein
MILSTHKIQTTHDRTSKLGVTHKYTRTKTLITIQCDHCNHVFEREQGRMDPKRLSNNYFHVCAHCNPKKFAQRRGAERRRLWDMSVDSDVDISRI